MTGLAKKIALAASLMLGVGCSASALRSSSEGVPSGSGGGGGFDRAGAADAGSAGEPIPTNTGGSGGAGSGTGGNGGGFAIHDGGAPSADGGASPDASAGPACAVRIIAVSPDHLLQLAVGTASHLRVRGEIFGTSPPATPAWTWSVVHETAGSISVTPGVADPGSVQFSLPYPGLYSIRAQVAPACSGFAVATAVDPANRIASFWVRVTPPVGSGGGVREIPVQVSAGKPLVKDLFLDQTAAISIDPHVATGVAVPSYLRVTSPQSTLRLEGSNKNERWRVQLNPLFAYDVLVVPDGDFAPALYQGNTPAALGAVTFTLDAGTKISGKVTAPTGPVPGARVLLRNGSLPSTIGISDAKGAFTARFRSGTFGAAVLPPAGSLLPEAQVKSSVFVPGTLPALVNVSFAWGDNDKANLDLLVLTSADTEPGMPVRVLLESDPADLKDVGTFSAGAGTPVHAGGVVRFDGLTGADGLLSLSDLPRARYRVTLATTGEPSPTITSAAIDTRDAGITQAIVRLGGKVTVSGHLVPAARSAGTRLVAIDTAADLLGGSLAAVVGEDGHFQFVADPGRHYRLFAEPDGARSLPRSPLGAIVVGTKDLMLDDRSLPGGISITGNVVQEGVFVAGAMIQAFCVGAAPDCVDPAAPRIDSARPVAETISTTKGFKLIVPDPGTGD